jgi:hypothetical protein
MNKFYSFLAIFFTISFAFSQGSEDFTNSVDVLTGSYVDGTFEGNNGVTWNYGHSRNEGDYPIDGAGIMLRRASDSFLEATLSGGVGTFSVEFRKAFTGTAERQLELIVNGSILATSEIIGTASGADETIYTFTANVNQPGDVTIKIKNVGDTSTNRQTVLDNITWTAFDGVAQPFLNIVSPANNTIFAPSSDVTVTFNVGNFVVGNPGAGIDGHIHYFLNDQMTMKYDTNPIELTGLASGTYTFTMELVDSNHQSLDPQVVSTITFEIASYTQVENLLALRQDVINNGDGRYYQIASNPVITYARAARNQKYVQDASAAILIDDVAEILSTQYVIGDAISGLKGRASYFNGLLQLIPTESANALPGTPVVPQVVNIEMLNENLEAYESELVYITNISITEADGTVAFAVNNNYTLTDTQNTIVLRTSFSEADYIDQVIPQGQSNVIVLVAKFVNASGTTNQVIARNMADLDATLSAPGFNAIEGLKMYPNPAKDMISINTPLNVLKNVSIYNVIGEEVLNVETIQNVSISSLTTGIYIVKITENGITATRKLIVE